ncbi:hypothetical protein ACFPOG_30625 [Paenibacillus aestuarii]|uniref:HNH endonuclease n=1 Tax=Paenibacillus aestuarii TaxID=516965 RepID=A0ABW0KGG9_9BACL
MNLSPEDLQKVYREIHDQLIAEFPPGTVEYRENDSDSKYIPVQPYIHRLETAAGMHWSWRLSGQPQIFDREEQIMVTGILKIVEAEREGIGFANFQRYEDTGKIKNLKYAILSASSDALRNACDLFEMGWKDLAPYRKWAKNPGTGLSVPLTGAGKNMEEQSSHRNCVVCQKPLTLNDEEYLKELNIKHPYHREHIPQHLVKNQTKNR